jgi:serine protein kinase
MNLVTRLEQYRAEEKRLGWQGTFRDYFDLVVEQPRLARLSHARVYDMITARGCEAKPNGERTYDFFDEELFGIEKPLQQLVDYFASAASRLEVRKRILLLMGPVGGGKSSIVTLLKRGRMPAPPTPFRDAQCTRNHCI